MKIKSKKAVEAKIEVTDNKTGEVIKSEKEVLGEQEETTDTEATPFCNVGVKAGYTKNMGEFEFARVDVSLHVPCQYAEIEEAFTFCKEWVEERLQIEIEELS